MRFLHEVLPARAGMSPDAQRVRLAAQSAPRTGGDEPEYGDYECRCKKCSPHGRG